MQEYLFDIGVKYNFTNTAIAVQYIQHDLEAKQFHQSIAVGFNHKLLDNMVWYGEGACFITKSKAFTAFTVVTGLKFEL